MKIDKFIQSSPIVPVLLLAEQMDRHLKMSLDTHGVTTDESLLLLALFFDHGTGRPSTIARTLNMSRPRLSQIVSRLSAQSLISRRLESDDARFILLQLTASGRSLCLKLIRVFDKLNERLEDTLGVKPSEQMASQVMKAYAALSEH